MSEEGSAAVSPTAHYTGQVWTRNGLSHPALATREGRLLFAALQPAMVTSRAVGGPSLEAYLLARHRAIDARLRAAIASGAVSQVIEIAAGYSPRGWRMSQEFGDAITYVEADLPAMAAHKRRALARIGALGPGLQVRELDALRRSGPGSLGELVAELDPGRGLAVVTEGLLGYLSTPDTIALWERLATALDGFSAGRYISDLHLGDVVTPVIRGFRVLLGAFVRGRVHLHFDSAAEAEAALQAAGFAHATVRPAGEPRSGGRQSGGALAHILEASTA